MKNPDIAERIVLVTGGGGRFGQSLCQALAAQGCKVLVGDCDMVKGREAAARCGGVALGLDVTDAAMWMNVHQTARDMFGQIGLIFHCANLMEEPAAEQDALNRLWATQVGALELAEAAWGDERVETGGVHVLFVSAAAWMPDPRRPMWSATQAAKRHWHTGKQLNPQQSHHSMLVAYDVPPKPGRLSDDREIAAATLWGLKRRTPQVFVPGGFGVKGFCRKSAY